MLRQLQGPMFGRLLLLGCIQYFVIAVSAIVVIGPLFLIPLWAVTIPVMMIERTDIGGAFNRSMDLTRRPAPADPWRLPAVVRDLRR